MAIHKTDSRMKRKERIRKKISGTSERPRLCIYKSNKHIYAFVVDDSKGNTLLSMSTLDNAYRERIAEKSKKAESAKVIGEIIAKRCLEKNIKRVVFDRNGFSYMGRVSALADSAREAGLQF
jgi:large subunit ribosomal protein L18